MCLFENSNNIKMLNKKRKSSPNHVLFSWNQGEGSGYLHSRVVSSPFHVTCIGRSGGHLSQHELCT